jgi:hypothetical protein
MLLCTSFDQLGMRFQALNSMYASLMDAQLLTYDNILIKQNVICESSPWTALTLMVYYLLVENLHVVVPSSE